MSRRGGQKERSSPRKAMYKERANERFGWRHARWEGSAPISVPLLSETNISDLVAVDPQYVTPLPTLLGVTVRVVPQPLISSAVSAAIVNLVGPICITAATLDEAST